MEQCLKTTERRTDWPTDWLTDGRTDRPGYRDTRMHLKQPQQQQEKQQQQQQFPFLGNVCDRVIERKFEWVLMYRGKGRIIVPDLLLLSTTRILASFFHRDMGKRTEGRSRYCLLNGIQLRWQCPHPAAVVRSRSRLLLLPSPILSPQALCNISPLIIDRFCAQNSVIFQTPPCTTFYLFSFRS